MNGQRAHPRRLRPGTQVIQPRHRPAPTCAVSAGPERLLELQPGRRSSAPLHWRN